MKKNKSSRLTKNDIRSRLFDLFEGNPKKSFTLKTVFNEIAAKTHPAKLLTMDVLDEMAMDDYIAATSDGLFHAVVRSQTLDGVFQRRQNGRNVVIPDDGGKPIMVFDRNAHHALDGDRVRITLLARRSKHAREAEVVEILERKQETFVGRLKVDHGLAFLITESRILANDIVIPKRYMGGAENGDKVVVRLVEWPDDSKNPIGRVTDVLGKTGENDAEMNAILVEFGLPYEYPKKVEEAANQIEPGITLQEISRREDFRNVTTFTIDPHDAKDFDDALSLRRLGDDLWEVGVHIADVSHYVKEGDIIDKEAERRATSIYLVDRTIPMLPERLCNFICSLRPDEEKLTYSCIFRMNSNGDVRHWHLAHTVIRSNRRFTYEEVQDILEQNGEASESDLHLPGKHPEIVGNIKHPVGEYAEELITLNRLAKRLRENRFHNGSIDFNRPEIRFDIDEKGHPTGTYMKIACDANKLVEEFMLLANRSVAESVGKVRKGTKAKVLPYRIHDIPDPERMENLKMFASKFGYRVKSDGTKGEVARSLNKLMTEAKGRKEENLLTLVALRAMQKARYSTHNIGHYGLMFDYYTHFTSPSRRYPDTMVHRLLTRYAEGGRSVNQKKYEDLCEHCSDMEQIAANAERASIKYKQVEFMGDRLGQEFDGTISGITEFGLYVEITENGCEGMVPLRDLQDDYYEFDDRNYCLIGRRRHHRYSLGDKVRIRVARANLERKQLDFQLLEE